jgi:hypothetical protein
MVRIEYVCGGLLMLEKNGMYRVWCLKRGLDEFMHELILFMNIYIYIYIYIYKL